MRLKKSIGVLIALVITISSILGVDTVKAAASTYYVAVNGNDSWSGKIDSPNADGTDGPFKTIQKAADVAEAGDTVIIRKGTYRETVTPYNYGTKGAPITFKNYKGEKVTISGADIVSGWEKDTGNIYKATSISSIKSGINSSDQVFEDGKMINLAQQPNNGQDQSRRSFQQFDFIVSDDGKKATIKDAELTQPDGFWNGAFIHFQPKLNYFNTTGKVTEYKKGVLTFEYDSTYGEKIGIIDPYGSGREIFGKYYLFGVKNALDSNGEWYIDNSKNTLYLRTLGNDDPGKHLIEMKKRDYGFILAGKSYINIEGLNFFACTVTSTVYRDTLMTDYTYGKTAPAVEGISINGIRASYVSHVTELRKQQGIGKFTTGIILKGNDNVIKNSIVEYSAGNGIFVYGERIKVINNIVHDVNYAGLDRCSGITTGDEGVSMARDIEIGHNTVYRAGRSLIEIRSLVNGPLKQSRVHHNKLSEVCLQTADNGAIYTFGKESKGVEVDHNVISNIHGDITVALYFDNNSDSYKIHHNLVYDADCALNINSGSNHKIFNNTFVNEGTGIVDAFPKTGEGIEIYNNIIRGSVNVPGGAVLSNNLPFSDPVKTFAGALKHIYQLKKGSKAINAGKVSAMVFDNRPGSSPVTDKKPDIGCFEFGSKVWTAGAVNVTVNYYCR